MQKTDTPVADFEPGKLIVCLKDASEQNAAAVHAAMGTSLLSRIPELNLDIVSVTPGTELEMLEKYNTCEAVSLAEPNYLFKLSYVPNDPFYTIKTQTGSGPERQWGLRRINPEPAWDEVFCLQPSLKIAILDSGIDPNHPDLAAKIVDPINVSSADPNDYIDRFGHGTFVAGIAAAITDNCQGIAGTSFNTAFIMPVKIFDESPFPLINALVGVVYAVQKGANVINMSFGGHFLSVFFQLAINFAWNNNVVLVAAAGNDGSEQVFYPAGNNYVLAVAATNKANELASFSNWGLDIGVAAPGVEILTTFPPYLPPFTKYNVGGGTSASAPFVAGVAALLFAVCPSLTNQEVVQKIQQGALLPGCDEDCFCRRDCCRACDCGPCNEWGSFFGYGLLNAGRAVELLDHCRCVKCKKTLGSFYGQIVDKQTGIPVNGSFIVTSGRRYITKDNVPTLIPGLTTDGMFRLRNLPEGTYEISAGAGFPRPITTFTADIVPGTDVYLRVLVE